MLDARSGTSRKATRRPSPARPSRRSSAKGASSARIGGPRDREFRRVGEHFAELPFVFLRAHLVEDEPVGVLAFARFDILKGRGLFDRKVWGELVARPGEGCLLVDPRPPELFFARGAADLQVEGFAFLH